MPPNIIYCEQQSPEWFAARLGKVTASHFAQAMMARSASGRKTYMMKLLAERMTGAKPKCMYPVLASATAAERKAAHHA